MNTTAASADRAETLEESLARFATIITSERNVEEIRKRLLGHESVSLSLSVKHSRHGGYDVTLSARTVHKTSRILSHINLE